MTGRDLFKMHHSEVQLIIVKVRSNKILTFRISEDFVFKHHCMLPTLGLQAYIPIPEYGLCLEVHS